MDNVRQTVRAYFASMTPDSKPMRPGFCPIMQALNLEWVADATRLDSTLARAIDQELRRRSNDVLFWSCLTAKDVIDIIDDLNAREAA